MPLYSFYLLSNPKIEQEFFFSMKDAPRVGSTVKIEGKKWVRIFSENISGHVKGSNNPCSAQQFVEKTSKMKGNVGNVIDMAKEESYKREKKYGRDSLKDSWFDSYSKKRGGKRHPQDNRK